MTDGILVEDLVVEANKMAENGESDLSKVIHECEKAR